VTESIAFAAIYFDGRTAQRHTVSVRLGVDALNVVGVDEGTDGEVVLDRWPYGEIELSDEGRAGVRLIKRGTEARLVIADPNVVAALQARSPVFKSHRRRTMRNIVLSVLVAAAIAVVGYFSLPLLSGRIVDLIPFETEVRLGNAYADDVALMFSQGRDVRYCESAKGRQALDDMVAYLSRYSHGPFAYRVDILDTPLVNAMALPGGRILLFRGVLDHAESPDEVAGVLAHEMQHVNLRHGMQALVRSYGVDMVVNMMFGGSMAGKVSQVMMMLSYSRSAELAADEGAIETLRRSGIGTVGMATFFARLQDLESKKKHYGLPQFLSTHPPSLAREALALQASGVKGGASRWPFDDTEWSALKAICQ
jgi:Zn-dependent protease with chaperone function